MTRQYAVWYGAWFFLTRYIPPPPLAHPLSEMTAECLERTVIRYTRLDDNWRSHQPTPFRELELLPPSTEEYQKIVFVPGGKWMVVSTLSGLVQLLNLDSKHPQAVLIGQEGCRAGWSRLLCSAPSHGKYIDVVSLRAQVSAS